MEIIRKDKNISIENLNLNFKVMDKEFKEQKDAYALDLKTQQDKHADETKRQQ